MPQNPRFPGKIFLGVNSKPKSAWQAWNGMIKIRPGKAWSWSNAPLLSSGRESSFKTLPTLRRWEAELREETSVEEMLRKLTLSKLFWRWFRRDLVNYVRTRALWYKNEWGLWQQVMLWQLDSEIRCPQLDEVFCEVDAWISSAIQAKLPESEFEFESNLELF